MRSLALSTAVLLLVLAPDGAPAAAFSVTVLDRVRITGNPAGPNFQLAVGTVAFDGGPFASAVLVVDLETDCFPFSKWLTNPPPPQGVPPGCDGFDRALSVSLDGPPAVELMRAVTPFGGPRRFTSDVTDVANGLPGAHTLAARLGTLGNSSAWTVTVRIDFTPGPAPRTVLAVLPLVDTAFTPASHSVSTAFSVPPGTTAARLEYRTTGFGSAGGSPCTTSGEEFCQRAHRVRIDGADVQTDALIPWRDCACMCTLRTQPALPPVINGSFQYCDSNPLAVPASARAARANWCPATVTPPLTWDPPASHAAGNHTFEASVDGVAQFGNIQVSAVFFAFGPPTSPAAGLGSPEPASAVDVPLVAAVLPGGRSVLAGCTATVFATVINAGTEMATGVAIAPATFAPADFLYQTTDPATNALTGTANTPKDIPPGQAQSFVVAFTPTAPFAPTDVALTFGGSNTAPVAPLSGLNTLLLSASALPSPDIIALMLTPSGDGIVRVPGPAGAQAFSVAIANVGSGAPITVSADTGDAALPLVINVCRTTPSTGACETAIGPSLTTQVDAGGTPTFTVFVSAIGHVPFDPARNRIVVRFRDAGDVTRGTTNAAVTTD